MKLAVAVFLLLIAAVAKGEEVFEKIEEEGPMLQQEAVIESTTHTDEEIVAQSICESIMVINDYAGWVYAVGRTCASSGIATCVQICDSCYQHVQDPQTVDRTWTTIGAVHVYQNRPVTGHGTDSTATLGMKVYWSPTYHTNAACGPNYCCCRAA